MSVQTSAPASVTRAGIQALIAKARGTDGRHKRGVIGIRVLPDPAAAAEWTEDGQRVVVVPCVSALAVRAALREHADTHWLIVLTDRDETDLGPGILAHLRWQRLRNPDPWDAIRQRFDATTLDRGLLHEGHRSELAYGLLRVTPEEGWPAAPAGVLSRDHALGSVASRQLGLPSHSIDAFAVLSWTARPEAAATIADLRRDGGDELTDAVIRWLAGRVGDGDRPMQQLLAGGQPGQVLALGIVLCLLSPAKQGQPGEMRRQADMALARMEYRWAGTGITSSELEALGSACRAVVLDMLELPDSRQIGRKALAQADRVLADLGAAQIAHDSCLLPSSLTRAYEDLAKALGGPSPDVERAWNRVARHPLTGTADGAVDDPRHAPFHAAVRLERWLATEARSSSTLAEMAQRQNSVDAWADAAINTAAQGVDEPELARALESAVTRAQQRRTNHDRQFARELATATAKDGSAGLGGDNGRVWLIEDLLPQVITKVARKRPTMLLVLDGMSTGVATQILGSILAQPNGWEEIVSQGITERACALAAMPSLTEHSRTSLLTGKLGSGGQRQEQTGFTAAAKAAGLASAKLFHKKPLDTSRPGFVLDPEVSAAIDDVQGLPLVACVLNTIDDALDRSDPAGTTWTDEAVRHLRPLLAAALRADRAVILTADHGHVVERRAGSYRPFNDISSARSRADDGSASEDEVRVEGARVLGQGGRSILAVDEGLRYGPLKAGYHGGGSPAEVVVPLSVLIPEGEAPDGPLMEGWELAPSQEPLWWSMGPETATAAGEFMPTDQTRSRKPSTSRQSSPLGTTADEAPDLFSELKGGDSTADDKETGWGDRIVGSPTYGAQKKIAGRVTLSERRIATLIDVLVTAGGTRMPLNAAAVTLGIPNTRTAGAVAQLQKLLNVEGYPVLRTDGGSLVLDKGLLREQFEVGE